MIDIICPAGLSGTIRPLRVAEQKLLTNRSIINRGMLQEELIKTCWVKTLDAGLYRLNETDGVPWVDVLQGERFYAFVQIVRATYGDIWEFEAVCKWCRARMGVPADLSKLEITPLPEASAEKIRKGENRFEAVLPQCGKRLWFRILTGKEERRIPRIQQDMEDQIISATLALRVLEIEGVDNKDKMAFIEGLTLGDATELPGIFDEVDCGIETTVEVACGRCKAEQIVDVPFDLSFVLRRGTRGRKGRLRRKGRSRSYRR